MTPATRWLSLLFLLVGLCMATGAHAQQPEKRQKIEDKLEEAAREHAEDPQLMREKMRKSRGAARQTQPRRSYLDANNATAVMRDDGLYDYRGSPFTGANNTFPKGTSVTTTFAQGFMFGGIVKDTTAADTARNPRANGSTYISGMKPGGIGPNGMPEDPSATGPEGKPDHVWRVHRNWNQQTVVEASAAFRAGTNDAADLIQDQIDATREQYKYDWYEWPAEDGAVYQDCDDDGQYNPAPPEAVNGGRTTCEDLRQRLNNGELDLETVDGVQEGIDIPGKSGAAQTLWTVANDMGLPLEQDFTFVAGSPEIGIEVQYTSWAYGRTPGTALGNTAFHEAELIYRGKPDAHPHPTPDDARIDSFFATWWVDPDVGTFSNDFVGVDTSRSMAYAYNSGPQDQAFRSIGRPPAAVGFDILKGPIRDKDTATPDTLELTSFAFFAAGTEAQDPSFVTYTGTLEWFNLMRGVLPQPPYPRAKPFVNPITGQASQFANNGDPVSRSGWVDGVFVGPSDRRMSPNSGPATVALGDTVTMTVAQVNGQGSDYLQSIAVTRFFDNTAQFAFDQDFEIPAPPPSPQVTAAAGDQRVGLSWGGNVEQFQRIEDYSATVGGGGNEYDFQGYRVYQLPSATATLDEGKIVATFDEEDNVTEIRDQVFQSDAGTASENVLVQQLSNDGISRHASFSRDRLNFEPLRNGNDYYYAVTAFGYLENRVEDIPVRVQESPAARVTVRPRKTPPTVSNEPQIDVGPDETVPTTFDASGSPDTDVNVQVVLPDSVQTGTTNYTITTSSSWSLERGGTEIVSGVDFGDSRVVDGLAISVEDVSGSTGGDPTDDVWSFSTDGAEEADSQERKSKIGEISVFPNPYRGFNELENSRLSKFVRFTNLPSPEEGTTTIRIFTLSGNPVKVIRHDESSTNEYYEDWNLKNEDGTFVASGLYLVHVNTPFGDKELRLAVAMEEEILPNY